MKNSKRGLLPLRHGIHLSKIMCPTISKEVQHVSRIPYASTIGSLIYAMLYTRSDIVFAMSVTSRYRSNPDKEHWIDVKNILKYLRRTKDLFLVFRGGSEWWVEDYTNLDFMSDSDDRNLHQDMYSYAIVVQSAESISNRASLQIWPQRLSMPSLQMLQKKASGSKSLSQNLMKWHQMSYHCTVTTMEP